MKKATIAGRAFATLFAVLAIAGCQAPEQHVALAATSLPAIRPSTATTPLVPQSGFIYGRITTDAGDTYEGRLRWGGDQEAFWGDYFNGAKNQNRWIAHASGESLAPDRPPISIFGFTFADAKRPVALSRPFMARFGDIARIEATGRFAGNVRVTLKSGTVFEIDRNSANDFDDGVTVWDARGVIDLHNWAGGIPPPPQVRIRTIELLATAPPGAVPARLHGTVRTRHGEFTGFLQWDRQQCLGSDELDVRTADGEVRLRFDTIRSIARRSGDSSVVMLLDGREIGLSGSRESEHGNRGIYVDDQRYGRVLISWDAVERVDFGGGDTAPAYDDFPPGRPLTGTVVTRAGRRLAGRLVYDLDESETTETLDAPLIGVDYMIPLGLIASIVPDGFEEGDARRARVTLHSGETLQLEQTGDLGERNAGILIFIDGGTRPEYVRWTDLEQINFDRPGAMYPPPGGR